MSRRIVRWFAALGYVAALVATSESHADQILVSSFGTSAASPGPGGWFVEETVGAGSASITSFDDPSYPPGSASLMTSTDADKATVGVRGTGGTYGTVAQVLSTVQLAYDYYKASGSTNAAAAPAIQLVFAAANYQPQFTNDRGFTTLTYEPYSNLPGNPATDQWNSTPTITYDSGLFFASRGFGYTPPSQELKTLDGWLSTFNAQFQSAQLYQVNLSLGSGNADQTTFFDGVRINIGNFDNTYNFGPADALATPEPTTLVYSGIGILAFAGYRLRQRSKIKNA